MSKNDYKYSLLEEDELEEETDKEPSEIDPDKEPKEEVIE